MEREMEGEVGRRTGRGQERGGIEKEEGEEKKGEVESIRWSIRK